MGETSSDLALARGGDHDAFTRLITPLRRELHAHCYRILGSAHDADDALQDALVRAWRALAGFEGRSSLRTWLYTLCTRTSLDLAAGRNRRALPMGVGSASDHVALEVNAPLPEATWLTAYPDAPADTTSPAPLDPAARYEQREAVELAFIAALQYLPGTQRAALILFDVLGYPATDIAAIMNTTPSAVNSALARARKLLARRLPDRTQQQTLRHLGDQKARHLVTKFATALEQGDTDTLISILTADVTWSMPPLPVWYQGRDRVLDFAVEVPITRCPSWQHRLITANAQPAVAFYLGESQTATHLPWSITVFTLRGGRISGIVSFLAPEDFPRFGLPANLPPITDPRQS
ncbi:sigma-70 family RNA polymerase sigma factor [Sinomonas sp. JGH33]|uniref:Sigma-70 family RNA polymerase sigma factor n=1 Tax=Sinomonas terricola TaxID=3110330 RepID=A0ABU5T0Q5_9MICC|nr:sigma-70 family RNA polymerase sigma factor [Sinomonas sp. JGH33]MEA5453234.1 sigma-70 family RNA polymerase sigma factor [Sinomonas sp. JGH33]